MEMNKQTVFSQGGRGIQGNEGEAASQGTWIEDSDMDKSSQGTWIEDSWTWTMGWGLTVEWSSSGGGTGKSLGQL